jgi:hypothetical protein
MFRANPELIAKAFDRLAEATMRLAEATYFERLARPCDFATWAKAEKKRRGMVRPCERALFAVGCIPAAKQERAQPAITLGTSLGAPQLRPIVLKINQ